MISMLFLQMSNQIKVQGHFPTSACRVSKSVPLYSNVTSVTSAPVLGVSAPVIHVRVSTVKSALC